MENKLESSRFLFVGQNNDFSSVVIIKDHIIQEPSLFRVKVRFNFFKRSQAFQNYQNFLIDRGLGSAALAYIEELWEFNSINKIFRKTNISYWDIEGKLIYDSASVDLQWISLKNLGGGFVNQVYQLTLSHLKNIAGKKNEIRNQSALEGQKTDQNIGIKTSDQEISESKTQHFTLFNSNLKLKKNYKIITFAVAFVLLLGFFSYYLNREKSPEDIFIENKKSMASIYIYDIFGEKIVRFAAGFFVSEKGIVAVKYYAIKDAPFIKIKTFDGLLLDVEGITFIDEENDYALLKVKNSNKKKFSKIKLGDVKKIDEGKEIVTIQQKS